MKVNLAVDPRDAGRRFNSSELAAAIQNNPQALGIDGEIAKALAGELKNNDASINFETINAAIAKVAGAQTKNSSTSLALDLLALARSSIRNSFSIEELNTDSLGAAVKETIADKSDKLNKVIDSFGKLKAEGKLSVIPMNYKVGHSRQSFFRNASGFTCPFTNCNITMNGREYTLVPQYKNRSVGVALYNQFGKEVASLDGKYKVAPLMYSDKDNLYLIYNKEDGSYLKTISLNEHKPAQETKLAGDLDISKLDPRNTKIAGDNIWIYNNRHLNITKINKNTGELTQCRLKANNDTHISSTWRSELVSVNDKEQELCILQTVDDRERRLNPVKIVTYNFAGEQISQEEKDLTVINHMPKLMNRVSTNKHLSYVANQNYIETWFGDQLVWKTCTALPFLTENGRHLPGLSNFSVDPNGNLLMVYNHTPNDLMVKLSPEAQKEMSKAWGDYEEKAAKALAAFEAQAAANEEAGDSGAKTQDNEEDDNKPWSNPSGYKDPDLGSDDGF